MKQTDENQSQPAEFRPVVGIDLGTTNSAIAIIRGGKPELLSSEKGERLIPSIVLIDPADKVIVGADARSALVAMPDRSVAAVKRRMGSIEPIVLAGRELLPQEVSALVLKELKSYANAMFGDVEMEAVITVPAYFTDAQRRATKEAGELAGFVVERIINEPTAAALAFGLEHMEEDRHFLVYDLGGGTFDVSVVEMMSGILEVKASAGDNHLGGEDFDWKLVDYFAERMISEAGVDPREDLRAKALLKLEAERVKIALSDEEAVSVALPLVTVRDQQPVGLYLDVSRDQFLELIEKELNETIACVQSVIKDAELQIGDIHDVLLVGGSTRIPEVRKLLETLFSKHPRADVNPDEAVALGAAVQAGLKSGQLSDSGLIATDVAPYSMGLAIAKEGRSGRASIGWFSPVIARNTAIPVTQTEQYQTSAPGQTIVEIEVYQGEHEQVKHNCLLGKFKLEDIPENWESPEKIAVTFRYNLNGILEVTAQCVSTGEKATITMQDALDRQSNDQFEQSRAELERLWTGVPLEEDNELMDDWELVQDELDLFSDLDEDEADELDALHDEERAFKDAAMLVQRLQNVMEDGSDELRDKAGELIDLLRQSIEANDATALSRLNDQATDLLIDAELS